MEILFALFLYLLFGIFIFATIWEGIEELLDDKIEFRKLNRPYRVTIRIMAILLWPVTFIGVVIFVGYVIILSLYRSMKNLYKQITK